MDYKLGRISARTNAAFVDKSVIFQNVQNLLLLFPQFLTMPRIQSIYQAVFFKNWPGNEASVIMHSGHTTIIVSLP